MHRSIWEQAFIPVDPNQASSLKIVLRCIATRVAEALGALALLLWLRGLAQQEALPMPLDTRVITWIILITVAAWLYITQKLREQVKKGPGAARPAAVEIDCERFPEQCPCTTN